jgi:nicotinate-nucleotide adenylyltransferase
MAPQEARIAGAQVLARHPRIRVTGLEALLGTRYTADSLAALTRRFPRVRFVWLMGADNLYQISAWQDWPSIFHTVVIAVFDRPSYSLGVGNAKAARRFARHRVAESRAKALAGLAPPAWTFIHNRLIAQSATQIRARGHNDGTRVQEAVSTRSWRS